MGFWQFSSAEKAKLGSTPDKSAKSATSAKSEGKSSGFKKHVEDWGWIEALLLGSVGFVLPFFSPFPPEIIYLGCLGVWFTAWLVVMRKFPGNEAGGRIMVAALALLFFMGGRWLVGEVKSRDFLLPANEPTPTLPAEVTSKFTPKQAKQWAEISSAPTNVFLFTGGGVVGTSGTNPITVFAYNGEAMLTVGSSENGAEVGGQFFATDGEIIAVLEKNRLVVNREKAFRIERPDKHSLVTFDKRNFEVLNLRYLNPRAFRFTGRLRTPGSEVVFTDDAARYGSVTFAQGVQFNYSFLAVNGPPRR